MSSPSKTLLVACQRCLFLLFALVARLPFCAAAEVNVKIEAGSCSIANEMVAVQVNLKNGRFDMSDCTTGTAVIRNAWFRLDRHESISRPRNPTEFPRYPAFRPTQRLFQEPPAGNNFLTAAISARVASANC